MDHQPQRQSGKHFRIPGRSAANQAHLAAAPVEKSLKKYLIPIAETLLKIPRSTAINQKHITAAPVEKPLKTHRTQRLAAKHLNIPRRNAAWMAHKYEAVRGALKDSESSAQIG